MIRAWSILSLLGMYLLRPVDAFSSSRIRPSQSALLTTLSSVASSSAPSDVQVASTQPGFSFDEFVSFLEQKQVETIQQLEDLEQESATFSNDPWGVYAAVEDEDETATAAPKSASGGRTRVIQGGNVVEKGACSLTVIRNGVLTADRAKTISGRQEDKDDQDIVAAGSPYRAAALSMVLHSKSPMVPTFRSDVRVFCVTTSTGEEVAWFGGGADLTPYYLIEEDVQFFHRRYKDLCEKHDLGASFDYNSMKKACDDYFYLPARQEHRGTGGIFYDDLLVSPSALAFTQGVVNAWMPSWNPIVQQRNTLEYTPEEKYWQMLRRGRYLEFNLLYDRGVKFGLMNANPRVEGVMVSAPPQIAFEYNHVPAPGSREEALMAVLKAPREWV